MTAITIESTKGTKHFRTVEQAAAWLTEYQPSHASADGEPIEWESSYSDVAMVRAVRRAVDAASAGLRWYITGEDQGQIVEVAYAYDHEGGAYRRTTDYSVAPGKPGRVSYDHGELDWDREEEGFDPDRTPCVIEWVPCSEPRS